MRRDPASEPGSPRAAGCSAISDRSLLPAAMRYALLPLIVGAMLTPLVAMLTLCYGFLEGPPGSQVPVEGLDAPLGPVLLTETRRGALRYHQDWLTTGYHEGRSTLGGTGLPRPNGTDSEWFELGWPAHSLATPRVDFRQFRTRQELDAAARADRRRPTTSVLPAWLGARKGMPLPARVLPMGFALSSAAYALPVAATIATVRAARRSTRRRRNLCQSCDYPLTGLDRCPECGRDAPARSALLARFFGSSNPHSPGAPA